MTIAQQVKTILSEDVRTRTSDKHLLMVYFSTYHNITSLYQLSIAPKSVPHVESVLRAKRRIFSSRKGE